jgi:transketolase
MANVPGPGYLRLGRAGEASLHSGPLATIPLSPQVMREGSDVVLVATGNIVGEALKAGEILQSRSVNARIVSLPMLKPLDEEGIWSLVGYASVVVTVEEHSLIGGLRDTLAPLIASRAGPRLVSLGIADCSTFGVILGQDSMRKHVGIDAQSIADEVCVVLK